MKVTAIDTFVLRQHLAEPFGYSQAARGYVAASFQVDEHLVRRYLVAG